LLHRYAEGRLDFFVPDLLFAEFANVFWKAERCSRCDKRLTDIAIQTLVKHGFRTFRTSTLLDSAVGIARAYGRTVYDSVYIALAVETKTQMITADQKLANALATHLPVVWLGAIHSRMQ